MKYGDIKHMVWNSNAENDWVHSIRGKTSIAFYAPDVDLRIEWGFQDADIHDPNFAEVWTEAFENPKAKSYYAHLLYRSTVLEEFIIVYVDGESSLLPLPIPGTQDVRNFAYCIAKIIDGGGMLDQTMEEAGLRVQMI